MTIVTKPKSRLKGQDVKNVVSVDFYGTVVCYVFKCKAGGDTAYYEGMLKIDEIEKIKEGQ